MCVVCVHALLGHRPMKLIQTPPDWATTQSPRLGQTPALASEAHMHPCLSTHEGQAPLFHSGFRMCRW